MTGNKKVILVLDTSWLMEIGKYTFNPLSKMLEEKVLNKGESIEVWIHGRVLKELDGLKNVVDKSHQARIASRYLREALNAFKSRIKISDFGIVEPKKEFKDSITSEVDAIILTLAEKAKKKGKVYLFTTDNNMKLLGENVGVEIAEEIFITSYEDKNFSFDSVDFTYIGSPPTYSSSVLSTIFSVILFLLFKIISIFLGLLAILAVISSPKSIGNWIFFLVISPLSYGFWNSNIKNLNIVVSKDIDDNTSEYLKIFHDDEVTANEWSEYKIESQAGTSWIAAGRSMDDDLLRL